MSTSFSSSVSRGDQASELASRPAPILARGNMQPRVSIITATFNAAELLPRTMESIAAQTSTDWEWVVIDGGSRDTTLDLLNQWNALPCRWWSEPDEGIYDALNKGITRARGQWLYFIGAGDTLADPTVLQKMFAQHPQQSRLLYGDCTVEDPPGRYGGRFTRRRIAVRNICHQAIFYHRELFADGLRYDLRYPVWADWALNIACFADRRTRPKYVRTTVARYAGGGFSAARGDAAFLRDARQLVTKLGPLPLAMYHGKQLLKRLFKVPNPELR